MEALHYEYQHYQTNKCWTQFFMKRS
uniref:Uncharacterized protein n=1 Tax=Amphimedon queenslandica TaxID=400682 RepID=A0A1X7UPG7_AMPQE